MKILFLFFASILSAKAQLYAKYEIAGMSNPAGGWVYARTEMTLYSNHTFGILKQTFKSRRADLKYLELQESDFGKFIVKADTLKLLYDKSAAAKVIFYDTYLIRKKSLVRITLPIVRTKFRRKNGSQRLSY